MMIQYFYITTLAVISMEFVSGVPQSRKLRTRLYPQIQKAEEVMDNYLAIFETDMSMPTSSPTSSLPVVPTSGPSSELTATPTSSPTVGASPQPSLASSAVPTNLPTKILSEPPSEVPSVELTPVPTTSPTLRDTLAPTAVTINPTDIASATPTDSPTASPSAGPTVSPTLIPTGSPTPSPTATMSAAPSTAPSSIPTETCNVSESGRAALISILVRAVSNPSDVDTPGSPQSLAADWLINEDPLFVCPQDPNLIQRYVMAVFYYSTRGDRWTQCSAPSNFEDPAAVEVANDACMIEVEQGESDAWLTPSNECTWGGLACDDEDAIIRIDFEQNGVAGTLPFELSSLQSLRFLLLEEGVLTGTIPSELGGIPSLEQIDLNFNLLQGTIPQEVYLLSNLRQMDLNDNELEGTISSEIGELSRLTFFQIENNRFSGTIPSEMGQLNSLEFATMEGNNLSGTMPAEVCANVSENLVTLTSDCRGAPNRPSPPLVICDCCTACF